MAVLDTAGKVWAKIQEFIGRIDALEDGKKEHDGELYHRAYGLTLMIQGYAVSDARRPVCLQRRFQAFEVAATMAV